MDRISQIKQAILELISKQKYLYEDEYSDLCYDLNSKEASAINDWIIQSYIPIKKNDVGRKYKTKVKNIVRHPSLSNQKKIKSALASVSNDINRLADAFEEERRRVEDAIRAYEGAKGFDWAKIKETFNKAIRLQDTDLLHQIQKVFTEGKFASFNKIISFNGIDFRACVAETTLDKARGLEVFSSLNESTGMLFPFEKANHVSFHMGSVSFPIDIIFLMPTSLGLKVAKIIHNAQPGSNDVWSCNDVSHVLEISGGSCKKYNIKLGDICVID